jgi:hypothetical protein
MDSIPTIKKLYYELISQITDEMNDMLVDHADYSAFIDWWYMKNIKNKLIVVK